MIQDTPCDHPEEIEEWLSDHHAKVQERRFSQEPVLPSAFGQLQEVQ